MNYAKEVLVEDERGRGFPAVVRYGPYLFISGSEGHRSLETEHIVPDLAGNADAQCRNSYGRIRERLQRAGYSGDECIWIQNFTSGQEWRLQRMALWPEYFGEAGHGLAVSFGAQARMWGINMITTVAMAVTPEVERVAVVPQPERGRAARVVKAGPFVYVIGVRGTGPGVPEETTEAFGAQLHGCWTALESHLRAAGAAIQDFVRVDACIRNAGRVSEYRKGSPDIDCGGYVVGAPMGARGEQEIGGIALAPGEAKDFGPTQSQRVAVSIDIGVNVGGMATREHRESSSEAGGRRGIAATAVKAGGLVFLPGCKSAMAGDGMKQTREAARQMEAELRRFGRGLADVVRLDVFLRDVYFEEHCLEALREAFGDSMPAISFVGADLEGDALVELVGIAGA